MKPDKISNFISPSKNFQAWAKENFTTLIGLPLKDFDFYISWEEKNEKLIQIPQTSKFDIPEISNFNTPLKVDEKGNMVSTFDLISNIGWILGGYEEHLIDNPVRDKLGRWEEQNSILSSLGFCEKPFINQVINEIRKFLISKNIDLEPIFPENKSVAIVLTHDIDTPYYKISRWISESTTSLLKGKFTELRYSVKKFANSIIINLSELFNRKHGFTELVRKEIELGVKSTIMVYASKKDANYWSFNDPFYSLSDKCIKSSFDLALKNGFYFGLHPSHNTAPHQNRYLEQKQHLENSLDKQISSLRHHYWNLTQPNSADALSGMSEAGFEIDTSISFYSKINYRRSIALPFVPFHPNKDISIPIVEVPSTLMDRWIGNGYEKTILSHVEFLKKHNGIAVLDWHCNRFNNKKYQQEGEALLKAIRILKSQEDVWIVPLEELVHWWKNRQTRLLRKS